MPVIGSYVTTESRHDIKVPIADIVTGTVTADGAIPSVATIAALRAGSGGSVDGQIAYVKGFYAAGDGGEGHFVWNAASTTADNTGTVIKASPATGRWLRQTNGGMYNVKWFGAKGDDSTDDAPAIQAAMNTGRALFFPAGNYRLISSCLKYSSTVPALFHGEARAGIPQSVIKDTRAAPTKEPILHHIEGWLKVDGTFDNGSGGQKTTDFTWPQQIHLENMQFVSHVWADDGCVELYNAQNARIINCEFYASTHGLTILGESHDTTIVGCRFDMQFFLRFGENFSDDDSIRAAAAVRWGLYASGPTSITGCVATGAGIGFYLLSNGISITGSRAERNGYGIKAGGTKYWSDYGPQGYALSRSSISGITMEANNIGLYLSLCGSTMISGVGVHGHNGAHGGYSETGVLLDGLNASVTLQSIQSVGYFRRGAVVNNSRFAIHTDEPTNGISTIVGGTLSPFAWQWPDSPSFHLVNTTMYPHATNARHRTITTFHDMMLPGLTGLNLRDVAASGYAQGGPVFAKNLGNVEALSNGATYTDVLFPVFLQTSVAPITGGGPEGSGGTLPAGTYWYAATIVRQEGETGIDPDWDNVHGYWHWTITSGQKIRVIMNAVGDDYGNLRKRRLYRGTRKGWFDGYWDNPTSPFIDDGTTPFTASGMPNLYGSLAARAEDDTNYQIVATPSWGTTVYVTNKATTGFRLNFGTAAPDANQTVAWLLFRP